MREAGLVPEGHFVRVVIGCAFNRADALPMPLGSLRSLDLSVVAGLDVFVIFSARALSGFRLQAACDELLAAGVESLRLVNIDEHRHVATLRVGHEEVGRWTRN